MSTSQLSPGTVVDGRFTVSAVLRTRVGATTYEASDPEGLAVALTIYDERSFPSSLVLERSLRELRQLQDVQSRRILPILASGRHGDGLFEVTARAPERTLAQHLEAGALATRDAAAILMQIGEALLEAQGAGVLHRNLGAEVVFPSADGVKVAGFAVGEPHGEVSTGSLETMAPEQVEGKVVDQRTLVYNAAALMHWMLSGKPLFSGPAETVLFQHVNAEPPEATHEVLRRALGKDARLRPMHLKQFLDDVAEALGVGGVEERPVAPAATPGEAKPTSRGWTMFMAAGDDDEAEPDVPAGSTQAASKPVPPAPASEAKPSTRGWTMFMRADEAEDEGSEGSSPAAETSPEPAEPAAEAKPSTRGWTMFMRADEDEEAEPAEGTKSSGSASPPAPAAEAKPSTRGWTMFMQADEAEDEDEAPAAPTEAASPSSGEPASQPAPAPSTEAKPSTRGWTMFMTEDGEAKPEGAESPEPAPSPPTSSSPTSSPPTSSPPTSSPPVAAKSPSPPEAKAPVAEDRGGPKSRGWTIFMEPSQDPKGSAAPPVTASAPAPAPELAPEPKVAPAPEPEGPGPVVTASPLPGQPQKKRGWTMFMNAPIPELKKPTGSHPAVAAPSGPASGGAPLGSKPLVQTPAKPVAQPAAQSVATPSAGGGARPGSDAKGWTVFGAPAPLRTPAAPPLTPPPGVKAGRGAQDPPRGGTVIAEAPRPAELAQAARVASGPHPVASSPSAPVPAPVAQPQAEIPSAAPASTVAPVREAPSQPLPVPSGSKALAKPEPARRTGWVIAGVAVGVGLVATVVAYLLG